MYMFTVLSAHRLKSDHRHDLSYPLISNNMVAIDGSAVNGATRITVEASLISREKVCSRLRLHRCTPDKHREAVMLAQVSGWARDASTCVQSLRLMERAG